MINFDDIIREHKKRNPNWPNISDYPYRIFLAGGSGSEKTNVLLNLINQEPDVDQIVLYAKDPYEAKYRFINLLINNWEITG